MFKSRIGIWAIVLSVCILVNLIVINFPKWTEEKNINIKIEIEDIELGEEIAYEKMNGYRINTSDNSNDIIITNNSDKIDGYTKKEDFLYSPIVAYISHRFNEGYPEGTIHNNNESYYKINLYSILLAIENDKTWEDIGYGSKVMEGKVQLYIPDEQCWYYPQVEELFYITLNKNKPLTQDDKDKLKPRVDKIIGKCEKNIDIGQAMCEEYESNSKNKKMFVAPEILSERVKGMKTGSSYCYIPAYFMRTTFVKANLYTKSNYGDETNVANEFVETIQKKDTFMDCTGWRVKNSTYDVSSLDMYKINHIS